MAEKEAALQQAEFSLYRALEEERRKWEVREKRLCDNLAGMEEELRTARDTRCPSVDASTAAQLEAANEEIRVKTSQLESSAALIREMTKERDTLKQENLELDELRAELTMWRARQQRLETDRGTEWSVSSATVRETCQRSERTGRIGTTVTTWTRLGGEPQLSTGGR